MSAPTGASTAPGDTHEAAEALTLVDALARAPAAAALVVAALQDDRANAWGLKDNHDLKALRLVHTQLRDASHRRPSARDAQSRPACSYRARKLLRRRLA